MFRRNKEYYKSHIIASAPGTHSAVAKLVTKLCAVDALILDLGAYTGAMVSRLQDLGYFKIVAADIDNHMESDISEFVQCDFNEHFQERFNDVKFDCIIASEVIEHLDDPRHFLSECYALLNNNGIVILLSSALISRHMLYSVHG